LKLKLIKLCLKRYLLSQSAEMFGCNSQERIDVLELKHFKQSQMSREMQTGRMGMEKFGWVGDLL